MKEFFDGFYLTDDREERLRGQFGVALTRDAQGLYARYGFKEYYDTCMYRM